MPNTYLDTFDYTRSTSGLEYQSLIGNQARFTSTQAQGTTSLTVPSSGANSVTVALNYFDRLTIFDGSSSEVVQVGLAGAAIGATSIPLVSGTQFAHSAGVAWCSDGILGSLADQIVAASTWIETTCNQALLLTTYTNELLAIPTMRASLGNEGILRFRPRHWPIQSLTALSIAMTQLTSTSYDPSQVFIESDKQICSVPNMVPLPGQQQTQTPYPVMPQMNRTQSAQLTITYQAGYTYASLPADLREAAILVTSDLLAKRLDPMGAPELATGDRHVSVVLRGDLTGESILIKRAMKTLVKYSVQSF